MCTIYKSLYPYQLTLFYKFNKISILRGEYVATPQRQTEHDLNQLEEFDDYEEACAGEVQEHIAYSSPDWDGVFEDGVITNEGTRGWCITRAGEAIIHANEPIVLYTVTRPREAVTLRMFDTITTGVLPQN